MGCSLFTCAFLSGEGHPLGGTPLLEISNVLQRKLGES